MMIYTILIILTIALFLYTLLAGADYGAGILSLGQWKHHRIEARKLVGKAMGPVWEANHIWLILIVVVLFVVFPEVFTILSLYLHWPIVALLIGIVLRGTAFVFLHYDLEKKDQPQRSYEKIFGISSLWTAFFTGVLTSTLSSGSLASQGPEFNKFFAPWLTSYACFHGIFIVSIFTALASAYLLAETQDEDLRKILRRKCLTFGLSMVIAGAFIFISSLWTPYPLIFRFFKSPVSVAAISTASFLLIPFIRSLYGKDPNKVRIYLVGIVATVIIGWLGALFPNLVIIDGKMINILEMTAGKAMIKQVLIALICGLVLITPSLACLLYIFKRSSIISKP